MAGDNRAAFDGPAGGAEVHERPAVEPLRVDNSTVGFADFVERTACQGEPMFFADPLAIMNTGRPIEFEDGTRGVLGREVSRAEYMDWKSRLFPGLPEENPGCKFFEMLVD